MNRLLAACVLFCCPLQAAHSQFSDSLLSGRIAAHDLTLPLYGRETPDPVAMLHARRVYKEYERKAFFHIGLLPVPVMEGVTLEVLRPEQALEAFALLRSGPGIESAHRFELRHVELLIAPLKIPCLVAGRARLTCDGSVELFDGVQFADGTNQVHIQRAMLRVTGGLSHRLIIQHSPSGTINLPLNAAGPTCWPDGKRGRASLPGFKDSTHEVFREKGERLPPKETQNESAKDQPARTGALPSGDSAGADRR